MSAGRFTYAATLALFSSHFTHSHVFYVAIGGASPEKCLVKMSIFNNAYLKTSPIMDYLQNTFHFICRIVTI